MPRSMTDSQREMLKRFADAPYGELYVRGAGRRTYHSLARMGYVEHYLGEGWGKITMLGRAVSAATTPGPASDA